MNFVFINKEKSKLVEPAIHEAISDEFRKILSGRPYSWDLLLQDFDPLLEPHEQMLGRPRPANCGCELSFVRHFRQLALQTELSGDYETELVFLGLLGLACLRHDSPEIRFTRVKNTVAWWTEVSNSLWMIATTARVLRRLGHINRAVSLLNKLGEMEPTADYANHDLLHVSYFARLANPYAVDLSQEKSSSDSLVDFHHPKCPCSNEQFTAHLRGATHAI